MKDRLKQSSFPDTIKTRVQGTDHECMSPDNSDKVVISIDDLLEVMFV